VGLRVSAETLNDTITPLSDAVDSTSSTTAATSKAVKSAYDNGLPDQSSNSGKYLTTDGSNASWDAVPASVTELDDLSDGYYDGKSVGLGSGALANDDGTSNKNVAVGKNALGSGTTAHENVAVGYEALSSNTVNRYNVAVGYQTLNSNTGESSTAIGWRALYANDDQGNVAVGAKSLMSSTSGSYNTAVGMESMRDSTTADNCVAVGQAALKEVTSGTYSTAVGTGALSELTTGSSNIGIGRSAGVGITTGSNNTVIGNLGGSSALSSTVLIGANSTERLKIDSTGIYVNGSSTALPTTAGATSIDDLSDGVVAVSGGTTGLGLGALVSSSLTGGHNTGVGRSALAQNTSGYNNTAFGSYSLRLNTTGTDNTSLGQNSSYDMTTGTGNTAVGKEALFNVTTAAKNIGVGKGAGDAITTGSNNTVIGDLAGTSTMSGTVLIGAGTTERLKIDSTGLYVNGSTTALEGGASDIDGLSDAFHDDTLNNLGAGYLSGRAAATGIHNIGYGYYTLKAVTSGSENTAIGSQSQRSVTTGKCNTSAGANSLRFCTDGEYNASFGYWAHYNTSTADKNSAFGALSSYYNTTGTNNVTVGYMAGHDITTGSNNTVLGSLDGTSTMASTVLIGAGTTERLKIDSTGLYVNGSSTALAGGASDIDGLSDGYYDGESVGLGSGALASDDGTNNYNVAVGKDAAPATTSGYKNCAFGWKSLRDNTTGNSNVAIGAVTLKKNTTGQRNTAIGGQALSYNTTGGENTAIGYDAAKASTTAEDNTAVGYGAMQDITTGVRNIAIGHSAGSGLTTGHENVIIGKLSAPTASMTSTVLVGCGTTERLKIDSTGLYVNGSTTALAGGASDIDGLSDGYYDSDNIGLGSSAFDNNVSAAGSTVVGHNSGGELTTGGRATLVGTNAGANTATGWNTSYIGYDAGKNQTGSSNTAVGSLSQTGGTNSSGTANTSVGYSSLRSLTSGVHNIGIGRSALNNTTSSEYNVAVGNYSLQAITDNDAGHNVAVGYNAGRFLNEGKFNTFVGDDAGYNTTVSTGYNTILGAWAFKAQTTGDKNIGVGYGAGDAVTTGSNNTVIGDLAGTSTMSGTVLIGAGTTERLKIDSTGLYVNGSTTALAGGASDIDGLSDATTSGNFNVGLGANCLTSLTTGSNNTAVGEWALRENTTASYNTAIGKQALKANTTGEGNVASGYEALKNNTTGYDNTAIGMASLSQNTTGNKNTAVSRESLRSNTTGSENTAIGYQAAYSNYTASFNTAIGRLALMYNTTGAKNIGLGYGAGDGITTGSNNTVIGDLAGTSTMADTVLIGAGTTERLKIDSTGLYVNGSSTALGGGGPSNPTGLVSGRYYTGLYDSETTSANTLLTNSVFYLPFMVHEDCTIDELCLTINGGTGNSGDLAQIALYGPVPDNLTSVPFITKTATFAVDSGYGKTLSITAQTVTKGIYLYSVTANTASLSIRKHNSQTKYINHMVGVNSPSWQGGCYGAQWSQNTVTTFPHSYPSTISASQVNHTSDAWQFKYGVQ
jgi:hypothetical protein